MCHTAKKFVRKRASLKRLHCRKKSSRAACLTFEIGSNMVRIGLDGKMQALVHSPRSCSVAREPKARAARGLALCNSRRCDLPVLAHHHVPGSRKRYFYGSLAWWCTCSHSKTTRVKLVIYVHVLHSGLVLVPSTCRGKNR